ncbi:MAG: hypothetical protein H0U95_03085 [Bacteroidetes bacterium]|nr:hypothetical protein [Bacteroidota bacterium]
MKRGTKITIFIASMALTVGSLIAFVGPRHCGHHGMYGHCGTWQGHDYEKVNSANWNENSGADSSKIN